MVDIREAKVSLTLGPMVTNYPNIILEELTSLSPHKETDFEIELKTNKILISKASDKMAPAELKKLKVQL